MAKPIAPQLQRVDSASAFADLSAMQRQLATIINEFESATARLHRLVERVPADRWSVRADTARWSVAECVEHLNQTGQAYLPILDKALQDAQRVGSGAPARYRRDPIGWLLWKTMGPPVRVRTKTIAAFIPSANTPPDELVRTFVKLQDEQVARVRRAEGLPLQRVRVQSPFDARVTYNLYSCLSMLPRHQHRHLWQAEHVWTRA